MVWWFLLLLAIGGALVAVVHRHTPQGALLLAILLAAAWVAPLVALASLTAPRRAPVPPPPPGEGSFADWMQQARLLGRLVLYYGDNPSLPEDVRRSLREAGKDLRDTFKAHPLRDDLERVCERVRAGAIRRVKEWFAREYRSDIREQTSAFEQEAAAGTDEDHRLLALRQAVEKAAAVMTRNCMPRMLARERLACAGDCAWLAFQSASTRSGEYSPLDLVEMLVIEWSDFSEPWLPARALRRAQARIATVSPAAGPAPIPEAIAVPEIVSETAVPAPEPELPSTAPAPAAEVPGANAPLPAVAAIETVVPLPEDLPAQDTVVIRNGKRYRRVRVKRMGHRTGSRPFQGPSPVQILLSFGQWLRYSVRSWLLYR